MKSNPSRVESFALIGMLLFSFLSFKAYSQNPDGSFLSFSNPNSAFYIGGRSEKNDHSLSLQMKDTYRLADSLLNISTNSWLRVKNPDREGIDLIFIRKPNGKIRAFQSLIDKGNYFILCSRGVEQLCDCKNDASLYFYLPEENMLKLVQRAFSLSIKRNLISDLNKYANLNLSEGEFENACSVLNAIIDRQ